MDTRVLKLQTGCQLFDEFGWTVQAVLGLASFSSLLSTPYSVKRVWFEAMPRPWAVWSMDTSKQVMSAGVVHCFNLMSSYYVETYKACTWYFLSLLADVFIGTALCYILLSGIENCLSSRYYLSFHSGDYGSPASWRKWVYQVLIWMLVVWLMKASMIGFMLVLKGPLETAGRLILAPLEPYPRAELVFVMVVVPVVLNGVMFWVTDNFLQKGGEGKMMKTPDSKTPLASSQPPNYTLLG